MLEIKYLGHSAFHIKTPYNSLLIDPFLTGNSLAAITAKEAVALKPTHILLTHGHDDHVGDATAIAMATGATVVAMVELCAHLQKQGVENTEMANYGGTVALGGDESVTLVPAWHTSNPGTGNPAGLVIKTVRATIYHAGDTCAFGDMALVNEMHEPTVGLIPIGGRFTMDAAAAALACRRFFNFERIVPIHYGTFPVLAPNADEFVNHNPDLPIHPLKPGESLVL